MFFSISVAFVMYATPFVKLAEQGLCSVSKVARRQQTVFRAVLRMSFVAIIFTVAAVLPVFAPIAGLCGAVGIVRAALWELHVWYITSSCAHSIRWPS